MVAKNNRTITLSENDISRLNNKILLTPVNNLTFPPQGTFCGNFSEIIKFLPDKFVDLLFLDPPYNLTKKFESFKFNKTNVNSYTNWLDNVFLSLKRLLKDTASVYICGDWFSSVSIYEAANKHFIIRNRITWEREKGRGSKHNWKNTSEDIWFCTLSNNYYFNVDNVKLRRKVLAPYKINDSPKDWKEFGNNKYRDTYPSNLWTDITIPFWSMPENTKHPTQKSEKLLAKLILASSKEGDFVLDPMCGSGTTLVTSKKLGRKYLGIELEKEYCLLCEKRLENDNSTIQGYNGEVFYDRNYNSCSGLL